MVYEFNADLFPRYDANTAVGNCKHTQTCDGEMKVDMNGLNIDSGICVADNDISNDDTEIVEK